MTVDSSPVKFTPALPGQPVPDIATISGGRPVFRAELPDGRIAWLVTGYETVRQMIIDQRFSRALAVAPGQALPGFEMSAAGSINGIDPPEHTRLRKLVASAFTARRIEALRPRVAGIVDQLIDAMAGRPQPADLVAAFSLPLPAQVICEMLGVPAGDLGQFHAWSDTIIGDWQRDSGEIMTAVAELYGYFGTLIEMKRAQPADDLISALIAARDDADRLSEHELTAMCCALLIAGHETTANHINLSLVLLLDHPDQAAKLRADPELIPGAVEELLRCTRLGGLPPARVTTEDVQYGEGRAQPAAHHPRRRGSGTTPADPLQPRRPPAQPRAQDRPRARPQPAARLGDAAGAAARGRAGRAAGRPGRRVHPAGHIGYTGMRWGETIGLERDLLLPSLVNVEWQLREVSGRFHRLPPKDDSYRSTNVEPLTPVDLPPFLAGLLAAQAGNNARRRCTCAAEHEGSGRYVFLGPDGGHHRNSNYARRIFRPACDGRHPPANGGPGRLVIADAAAWPGTPVASWPPAVPGRPFAPPSGRGTQQLISTGDTGRCPSCGHAVRLRLDGRTVAHKNQPGHCPGSGEQPADDTPLACWLPVKDGLTPHGLRHGHKTWMAEDGIPEILAEQRLGHQVPGMRGLYAHASQQMREKLTAALQARWEESLRHRAAIDPHSPVPLLDTLLAPFRAAPAGHPGPAPR